MPRQTRFRKVIEVAMFLALLSFLYPVFYMIFRSFLAVDQVLDQAGVRLSLEHYHKVLGGAGFLRYTFNSFFVLFLVLAGNLVFSIMVGYAFARYRFPFKKVLFPLILVTLMVPKQTLMVPVLHIMVKLGLHDTLWALILPFCVDSFNIFLIRQFIMELPADLEDAARVDGAGELQILWRVVFPLCRPAIAVMIINTTITTWNSFLFPLILTDSVGNRTLPVGLALYTQGPFSTDWGALMAGATVSSLPVIMIFLVFQREIIEGIIAGAVKE